jgi:hypothetical protein
MKLLGYWLLWPRGGWQTLRFCFMRDAASG